jgi:8-oxo-dGTP pyrophosphatase MutT (NUDIX family)
MSDDGRRPAAVVLGIFEHAPHGVIFVERATHLRSHAGQIGLPGGGMDAEDGGDLRVTAKREVAEEIGVSGDRVTIVGRLPVVKAPVNNYAVTPFVATVAPGELRIDSGEIAGAFTVPLATVLRDLHDAPTRIGSFDIVTPVLEYETWRIWGLTGVILRSFVDSWNAPDGAMRQAIESRLLTQS